MHCASAGARFLTLVNRTVEKLEPLHEAISAIYPRDRQSLQPWNDKALVKALDNSDLVINCSSLGMKPDDPSPIPAALLAPQHLLFDTIYNSERTPLMRAAATAGARSANGLSMLLYQGAIAFEIWFQRPAPLEVMREALFAAARIKQSS
jgi:shikimate dehydrogenase